jgi:hypothetical protein
MPDVYAGVAPGAFAGVSSFAVKVGSIPGAEDVSADHQCIAWCNQVVVAAAEGFLDVAAAAAAAAAAVSHWTVTASSAPHSQSGATESVEGNVPSSARISAVSETRTGSEAGAETAVAREQSRIVVDAAARRDIMAARLLLPQHNGGNNSGEDQSDDDDDDGGGKSALDSFVSTAARHTLTWTPSMVPAMAAHAAMALCVIASDGMCSKCNVGGAGGGGVMRLVSELLTKLSWWVAFIGLVATAGLGAVPWLAPPPVGGVMHGASDAHDVLENYAALCAVYVCSVASLALEGLAVEQVLKLWSGSGDGSGGGGGSSDDGRVGGDCGSSDGGDSRGGGAGLGGRRGGDRRGDGEGEREKWTYRRQYTYSPLPLGERRWLIFAAAVTTAAACVVQPPLGLAIGLLARCWAAARAGAVVRLAVGGEGGHLDGDRDEGKAQHRAQRVVGPATAAAVCHWTAADSSSRRSQSQAAAAALLQLLLALQTAALIAPSAVAVIQVIVESRGARWVTCDSLEDVALALATALPALLPLIAPRHQTRPGAETSDAALRPGSRENKGVGGTSSEEAGSGRPNRCAGADPDPGVSCSVSGGVLFGASGSVTGSRAGVGVGDGGNFAEKVAYGLAAAVAAAAVAPGRAHLAQHAAAIASSGPVAVRLLLGGVEQTHRQLRRTKRGKLA